MVSNNTDSAILTLHYDGSKLSEHKMQLDSFIDSVNGFKDLVLNVSKELGIPPDNIVLEILPVQPGGVKVNIAFAIIGFAIGAVGNNIIDHFIDDLQVYERLGVPRVVHRVNQFLDRKKSVSNYKDLQQLTVGLDVEANRIMLNKQIHMAAEQLASALEHSADSLEISSTIDSQSVQIMKNDLPKMQNPFIETDLEENAYEEIKILRLEGIRYSTNEWIFYEKDSRGNWNKENTLRAVVLDDFLLAFGRDNSLNILKDKDLYCTVRCREITKPGNKKKTIERYIISCRLKPDSLF